MPAAQLRDPPRPDPPSGASGRVLFVSEAVTLAHLARPVTLARGIAGLGWTPVIAAAARFERVCPTDEWQTERITSITSERFLGALAEGSPLYDRATFDAYVEDDLALLRRVAPAVVVGDFRLSLSISARLAGVPYISVSNAYWSPYARPRWHVPALPWTRFVTASIGDVVFRTVRPLAFRLHAKGMESSRRSHGIASLGGNLLRHYTDGDVTLYADPPQLVPLHDAPSTHRHLGAVAWSPSLPLPTWWRDLDVSKGVVYVTLGSSGSADRLPQVVAGLSGLGLPVVVATAGGPVPTSMPSNVRVADYLPGNTVAAHSRLVVCNGGSPTSHQALMHGVPVLALPGNLDQFLNSSYLEAAGVGTWLRPERSSAAAVAALAGRLLADPGVRQRAASLAAAMALQRPVDVLAKAIRELVPRGGGAADGGGLVGRVGIEPTTKGL